MTAISKGSHDNKVREYFPFNNSSASFLFPLNQSLKFCFILKMQLLLTALTIIIINLACFLDIAKITGFYSAFRDISLVQKKVRDITSIAVQYGYNQRQKLFLEIGRENSPNPPPKKTQTQTSPLANNSS